MNYFICGFSGAGKSYLLKQLEQKLEFKQYQFIDLDHLIDQKYAASENYDSLGAMIEDKGLEHFRNLELQEIKAMLDKDSIVLALGGGGLNANTQPLLENWQGFWLATDFETCWKRIEKDSNRPLVKQGKMALNELYQKRLEFYQCYPPVFDVSQVLEITKW